VKNENKSLQLSFDAAKIFFSSENCQTGIFGFLEIVNFNWPGVIKLFLRRNLRKNGRNH